MPRTKQFEAVDINDLIFNGGKKKYLDMYEISEQFYSHITQIYKFLEEDKTVTFEVPAEDCLYHIKKIHPGFFELRKSTSEPDARSCYTAIELVNFVFAKAPFIAMVGYSNI